LNGNLLGELVLEVLRINKKVKSHKYYQGLINLNLQVGKFQSVQPWIVSSQQSK
jgi:hypothetical protein